MLPIRQIGDVKIPLDYNIHVLMDVIYTLLLQSLC